MPVYCSSTKSIRLRYQMQLLSHCNKLYKNDGSWKVGLRAAVDVHLEMFEDNSPDGEGLL